MYHSIGLFRKHQLDQANQKAEELIAEGQPNVHIEIEWTCVNIAVLGRYSGFYVNYGDPIA